MTIDISRMVSTIAIWLSVALVLITLATFNSDELDFIASLLIPGAVVSMVFLWRGAGRAQERERLARLKRHEGLAQRVVREEDLDDEDMTTLEELLEEQRATRRLRER